MSWNGLKKVQEILCDIYIGFMLTAFILFTGTKGYQRIMTEKYYVFLAAGAVLVLGTLFFFTAWLLDSKKKSKAFEELKGKITPVHLLLLAYLLFTVISAIAARDYGSLFYADGSYRGSVWLGFGRRDGVLTQFIYVFAFYALSFFARPKKWHVYAASGTLFVNCIISFLQLLNLNPLGLFPDMTYYTNPGEEFLTTIGNVDLAGAMLCALIPLLLVYFVRAKGDKLSPIALVCACLGLVLARFMWVLACIVGLGAFFVLAAPVILNDNSTLRRTLIAYASALFALGVSFMFVASKAAKTLVFAPSALTILLFGAAAALLCIFLVLFGKEINVNVPLLKRILWIAIAVILVLGILFLYIYPAQSGLMFELHEILHGRAQDTFGTSRIYIWRNVLEGLGSNWLLGTGPDSMSKALDLEFANSQNILADGGFENGTAAWAVQDGSKIIHGSGNIGSAAALIIPADNNGGIYQELVLPENPAYILSFVLRADTDVTGDFLHFGFADKDGNIIQDEFVSGESVDGEFMKVSVPLYSKGNEIVRLYFYCQGVGQGILVDNVILSPGSVNDGGFSENKIIDGDYTAPQINMWQWANIGGAACETGAAKISVGGTEEDIFGIYQDMPTEAKSYYTVTFKARTEGDFTGDLYVGFRNPASEDIASSGTSYTFKNASLTEKYTLYTFRFYTWDIKSSAMRVFFSTVGGGGDGTVYIDDVRIVKTRVSSIDCAHNEYLNILTNQGIMALLCYLGALGYSAYLWIKNKNSDAVCIAGAVILCYCAQAFFGISQFMTAPLLWIALGLFHAQNKEAK